MAEKKAKEEVAVVENKPTSKEVFVANQLKVLNMKGDSAVAQRNIERVLRNNRKEKQLCLF